MQIQSFYAIKPKMQRTKCNALFYGWPLRLHVRTARKKRSFRCGLAMIDDDDPEKPPTRKNAEHFLYAVNHREQLKMEMNTCLQNDVLPMDLSFRALGRKMTS